MRRVPQPGDVPGRRTPQGRSRTDGVNPFKTLATAAYLRETAKARASHSRCLTKWCDYCNGDARYLAEVNGEKIGQACRTHYGALLRDLGGEVAFRLSLRARV